MESPNVFCFNKTTRKCTLFAQFTIYLLMTKKISMGESSKILPNIEGGSIQMLIFAYL